MTLPKNNHGFSLIPIMVFLAIFSVIGFGVSNYLQNSADKDNDVLAAFAQGSTVNCIQNPSAAGCQSVYQKPAVNKSFFQGSNDTKPPWWRPQGGGSSNNSGGGGNDICDTQPDSQACADWQKFKNYCETLGRENKDPNCNNYLGTKFEDPNSIWANFCKSSVGKFDKRCLDNGLYCSANPSDSVCNSNQNKPTSTPTPANQVKSGNIVVNDVDEDVDKVGTPTMKSFKNYCERGGIIDRLCTDGALTPQEISIICSQNPIEDIYVASCATVKRENPPVQVSLKNNEFLIPLGNSCPNFSQQSNTPSDRGKVCIINRGLATFVMGCPEGFRYVGSTSRFNVCSPITGISPVRTTPSVSQETTVTYRIIGTLARCANTNDGVDRRSWVMLQDRTLKQPKGNPSSSSDLVKVGNLREPCKLSEEMYFKIPQANKL